MGNLSTVKEVEKIVKIRASEEDWNFHILLVVKYALLLAKNYKIDKKQVELAALLHDIGRLPYSDKKDKTHHIRGVKEATKILRRLKYPENKIKEIQKVIICHRGSGSVKPKTVLEKIIANADAMSHFDTLPLFYYWRGKRGESFAEITKWVEEKLDRNIKKKITLSQAQKMVREKYLLNKRILENLKKVKNF
ncbi:MAG: HD domain-containing protein [Patescibacteria group bacterium]|nr:HD domain-containing protein [Patescibacteria group bacterium]